MTKMKCYVRVMRPIFQRAVFTVDASLEEAAVQTALEQAGRLTDSDWALLETGTEQPVLEAMLPEEEAEGDEEDALEYLRNGRDAYALLQANLDGGEGHFIVPTWLKSQPGLMIADLTQDWTDALSGIYEEGLEAFTAWLEGLKYPANVVDFFAERDKRRGKPVD